jgi:hypothetical protein
MMERGSNNSLGAINDDAIVGDNRGSFVSQEADPVGIASEGEHY